MCEKVYTFTNLFKIVARVDHTVKQNGSIIQYGSNFLGYTIKYGIY